MTNPTKDRSITLRYFDGCPNWKIAKSRLEQALADLDLGAEIALERVETADEAERLGFRGSPTILIDEVDPFGRADAPIGFTCRVYRTDAGTEGSPSVHQLVAELGSER